MATPVLATKFFAPPPRPGLVLRQQLIERLNAGSQCKLTLVSAPAGYGKTTLITRWLYETKIPSAWFSLEEDDNDPIRFLQYFISALQRISPLIGVDQSSTLQGVQPDSYETLITLLINDVAELGIPFILVMDDFHVIHAGPILEMFTFLLEHLPPQMHLVLLSRTDPPLPLFRLRARNEILDIRADQLRFTLDEITIFLNEVMGLRLSAADIAALEARTEGWIAGLQLAALSMQGSNDIHSFVSAFTGSHRYIMDYLVEEVLNVQPERLRSFLLQTSLLDRMCGSLCNSVVDVEDREGVDGQEILEALEQMNLFVIPLDDERRWYRYHHLFADMLTRHLEHRYPQRLPELHQRASQWCEQNGFIPEAIHHSLQAGDRDRAVQLIEQNGCLLLMSGEVTTLLKWASAMEFESEAHPWLAIQKAWAQALTGHLDQIERTLQAPEQLLSSLEPTVEVSTMQGTIAAARAHCANSQGDTRRAAAYAQQALQQLPDCSSICRSIRSVAVSILGDASWINGNLDEATHAYTEAIRIGCEADNPQMVIIANSNLADVLMEQGGLRRAAMIYTNALQMAVRPDGQRSPLACRIFAALARLAYERNQLEDADQYVQHCIDLCRQWGDINPQAAAYALLSRLEQVRGNPEQAREAMREAEQLAGEAPFSQRWSSLVMSDLTRVWLAQGNLKRLSALVQQRESRIEDEIPYQQETEYMILLRLFLAHREYEAALRLSERLLQRAGSTGRMALVIEILIVQALAYQGKKDTGRALAALERALALAQPEGYVRKFLDEGERMAKLLHLVKARQIETGYAAELLSAMGEVTATTQPCPQFLIVPLSRREQEVLKLIEAGCSNQGIADELVISITTVKRHISNIYAKLGVQSRTQAVSIAKELRLFE